MRVPRTRSDTEAASRGAASLFRCLWSIVCLQRLVVEARLVYSRVSEAQKHLFVTSCLNFSQLHRI